MNGEEDNFKYEDYDWTPTYHHGITGVYIKWHKTLKIEIIKKSLNPSPVTRKFMREEEDGNTNSDDENNG